MNKTLKISFLLRNTYRVNSILYALKQIPFLGKLLPEKLYQVRELKMAANVLSILWEVLSVFLGKLIYLVFMVANASHYYPMEEKGRLCVHILIFLSVIGAFLNTYLLDGRKEKYYALIMLRMDARKYTLLNYGYALFKTLLGFLGITFIVGGIVGIPAWQCALLPFFIVGLKLSVAAGSLRMYERKGKIECENMLGKWIWAAIPIPLAAAYGLPAAGILISQKAAAVLMLLPVITGCFAVKKILGFGEYNQLNRQILTDRMNQIDEAEGMTREKNKKLISVDMGITSSRSGFEYLNELFIKRHRKILWKASRRLAAVCLFLFLAGTVFLAFQPAGKEVLNESFMDILPPMVFFLYAMNRGSGFTEALFMNCDHCLLTYPFYKQPKHILRLFRIRLREIIKINLLPAVVVSCGLTFLLYFTGGTDDPVNYILFLVSIPCMSIFFSVHYLVLYYLLQPYNADTKVKNMLYPVIQAGTYLVSFQFVSLKVPPQIFGLLTIGVSALYCAVACMLVYRFAPKTFKLRK